MVHDPASEQNFMTIATRASRIINRFKQTSIFVILLICLCGLQQYVRPCSRTLIEEQLREQYETALYEGGISPGMVPGFAWIFANNNVTAVELASFGNNRLIYFLFVLGQIILSIYVLAVAVMSLTFTGSLFDRTVTGFYRLKRCNDCLYVSA